MPLTTDADAIPFEAVTCTAYESPFTRPEIAQLNVEDGRFEQYVTGVKLCALAVTSLYATPYDAMALPFVVVGAVQVTSIVWLPAGDPTLSACTTVLGAL